jgi:DNA-binding transcriptional MerR regulator
MRSAARRPRDLLFDQQLDPPSGGDRILSDMTASLSIGEYSRATYLSVKTLRHYHEVGLLEPAHVDPSSGYRYYRPDQIGTAPIIRRLRDLEMPVERVKGVLDATDLRARQALIAAHLKDMEEQLERTAAAVTAPRTLLEEPAGAAAISYRTAAATKALTISAVVTLDELIRWWTAAFDELSDTLAATWVRPAGSRDALYPRARSNGSEGRSSCSSRSPTRFPPEAARNPCLSPTPD